MIFRQPKAKPVTVATSEPKKAVPIRGDGFSLSLGYVTISILPDEYDSPRSQDREALTFFEVFPVITVPSPNPVVDPATNKVTSFTAPPAFSIGLKVQTHGNLVKPERPSDYGYGTRPQDTKAKQNTIRFHEGSHGTEFISYVSKEIKKYPLPVFEGKTGMTLQEFNLKDKEYVDKISAIYNMFKSAAQYAKELVDCAGISIDKHNKGRAGYVNVCP